MRCILLATLVALLGIQWGCVTQAAYQDAMTKLERSHARIIALTEELEAAKREAATEIHALRQAQDYLGGELMKARRRASQTETELQSTQYHLASEREKRQREEAQVQQLKLEQQKLHELVTHLEDQSDDFLIRLDRARTAQGHVSGRLESLKRERARLMEKLRKAQSQVQMLDALVAIDRKASARPGRAKGR